MTGTNPAKGGAPKRPAHRPVTVDARRVNVTLDGATIERAKALGNGNLSAGLREAVRIAQPAISTEK